MAAIPETTPVGEPTLDEAVEAARLFALARLPREPVRALLDGGFAVLFQAGGSVPPSAQIGYGVVITSGLIRAYVSAPDGRQTTSGYLRRGDLVCPLAVEPPAIGIMPIGSAAGWVFEIAALRRQMSGDATLAAALAEYSVGIVYAAIEQLRFASFANVRQRVVRHILELPWSAVESRGFVSVRTQEIADAIGSVREVVSRTLRELERGQLVRCRRDGVFVLEPERLLEEILPLAPNRALAGIVDPPPLERPTLDGTRLAG